MRHSAWGAGGMVAGGGGGGGRVWNAGCAGGRVAGGRGLAAAASSAGDHIFVRHVRSSWRNALKACPWLPIAARQHLSAACHWLPAACHLPLAPSCACCSSAPPPTPALAVYVLPPSSKVPGPCYL